MTTRVFPVVIESAGAEQVVPDPHSTLVPLTNAAPPGGVVEEISAKEPPPEKSWVILTPVVKFPTRQESVAVVDPIHRMSRSSFDGSQQRI